MRFIGTAVLVLTTAWTVVLAVSRAPEAAYAAPLATLIGFALGVFHERSVS